MYFSNMPMAIKSLTGCASTVIVCFPGEVGNLAEENTNNAEYGENRRRQTFRRIPAQGQGVGRSVSSNGETHGPPRIFRPAQCGCSKRTHLKVRIRRGILQPPST